MSKQPTSKTSTSSNNETRSTTTSVPNRSEAKPPIRKS